MSDGLINCRCMGGCDMRISETFRTPLCSKCLEGRCDHDSPMKAYLADAAAALAGKPARQPEPDRSRFRVTDWAGAFKNGNKTDPAGLCMYSNKEMAFLVPDLVEDRPEEGIQWLRLVDPRHGTGCQCHQCERDKDMRAQALGSGMG